MVKKSKFENKFETFASIKRRMCLLFMNVGIISLLMILASTKIVSAATTDMITEWNVSGDAGLTITLPVQGTGLNITVDWGDGTSTETVTSEFPTHTYSTAGTYDITISGTCKKWGYNSNSSVNTTSNYYTYTQYLTGVKQWGELSAT